MSVALVLPDGAVREVAPGTTGRDVAAAIGPRLLRDALAARVGERVVDLARPVEDVSGEPRVSFAILTVRDPAGLEVYRHTTTHVMAQAVRRLYPRTRLAIGPVIEDGFYYDMDVRGSDGRPVRLSAEDLPAI